MEAEDDYVEVPILLQKMANSASSTQCTNKTIYFVTLACFSVILIYPHRLFSYFTIILLSVMTAVTFPLRPPRLAFAICGWRWQNDVHEIKYSVCVLYYYLLWFGNTNKMKKILGSCSCSIRMH